jgi:signal transduction histidine kinase
MLGPRTLRSRLFSWFVAAIVLSALTSALIVWYTRPESAVGVESVAGNIGARLGATWERAEATREYVDEVRDVTGYDVRLEREARSLPAHVRRAAERGAVFVVEGPRRLAIPVVHGGDVVGALEVERPGLHAGGWVGWRFATALLAVLAVLSAMAGGVANQLARPLERLARAADRFGAGDLAFRTDVVTARHGARRAARPPWVAREVRDVAVSFNRMADRVEAMVRGQRELLGAISHELRSPLGRARVALEIARERLARNINVGASQGPDASAAVALDDIDAQLVLIDGILGDLLDLTRASLADVRKQPLDLVPWLRERAAEEPPPPSVAFEHSASTQVVSFDPALLRRALHNLLVNARGHGHPADRPIELHLSTTVRAGSAWARVGVRDRGAGFAPGFVERAFEPFVRGDAARARPQAGGGYGLGLAIVKRVVEAHGGRVFAGNNPTGGGAEVGFELPLPQASTNRYSNAVEVE